MTPSLLLQPGLVGGDNLVETEKQEFIEAVRSPMKSDKVVRGKLG